MLHSMKKAVLEANRLAILQEDSLITHSNRCSTSSFECQVQVDDGIGRAAMSTNSGPRLRAEDHDLFIVNLAFSSVRKRGLRL